MNSTSEAVGKPFGKIKHTRHFAKCGTCGSFGHNAGLNCPADRINRQQEKLTKEIETLGLSAEVQMKVDEVKRAWRSKNAGPVLVDQVSILRTAWGCR